MHTHVNGSIAWDRLVSIELVHMTHIVFQTTGRDEPHLLATSEPKYFIWGWVLN